MRATKGFPFQPPLCRHADFPELLNQVVAMNPDSGDAQITSLHTAGYQGISGPFLATFPLLYL